MVNEEKLALVQKIQDLLSKNRNFALIKIDKTNHQTLENLRKQLKKTQAVFRVIKNSLFQKSISKLASDSAPYAELKKSFFPLRYTSALILFEKEWGNGLVTFYQFSTKESSISFKFGLLDGHVYKSEELLKIAKLPPKNQLIANLIGSFKSPSSRLIYSMKFNLTKLIFVLKEKAKKSN